MSQVTASPMNARMAVEEGEGRSDGTAMEAVFSWCQRRECWVGKDGDGRTLRVQRQPGSGRSNSLPWQVGSPVLGRKNVYRCFFTPTGTMQGKDVMVNVHA